MPDSGINAYNMAELKKTGAKCVALCGVVACAEKPADIVRKIKDFFKK